MNYCIITFHQKATRKASKSFIIIQDRLSNPKLSLTAPLYGHTETVPFKIGTMALPL